VLAPNFRPGEIALLIYCRWCPTNQTFHHLILPPLTTGGQTEVLKAFMKGAAGSMPALTDMRGVLDGVAGDRRLFCVKVNTNFA
jgi:hypothetical protein